MSINSSTFKRSMNSLSSKQSTFVFILYACLYCLLAEYLLFVLKMASKRNRFKIKCLECGSSMDNDYHNKHNKKFHAEILKKNKPVRYETLNAPKNPFEICSKRSKSSSTDDTPSNSSGSPLDQSEFIDGNNSCHLHPLSLARSSVVIILRPLHHLNTRSSATILSAIQLMNFWHAHLQA